MALGRLARRGARGARGLSSGRTADLVWAGRLAAAAVFVVFGIGKFTDHAGEVASFRSYGLPAPDAFVYAVGTLEVVGAVLLAIGLFTRLIALALAGNMVGAIVSSGFGEGEIISLTLAPALLAVMIFVALRGPGSHALDNRRAGS